ncbi:hypothetical protein ACWT_4022 [Actinoplanes sp. SE50]|nr:hypothetical protein ACPL_4151 [Actinoplanes sp. SE50/110]ATO83437.1 hypothetical protein ACWT_4022 [Actinoplanes sp. SE50]SLM00844.1 hypothetical protein ACSP50_4077 [Actinoplanes sp. SE50/110]
MVTTVMIGVVPAALAVVLLVRRRARAPREVAATALRGLAKNQRQRRTSLRGTGSGGDDHWASTMLATNHDGSGGQW